MYLELVDVLRCTRAHEDAPLVAAITRRADRDIVDGVLGCPVCHAEYPIARGVAVFGEGLSSAARSPSGRDAEPPDEMALRCAALLGLHDPGGIVVLGGTWGFAAPDLIEMTRTLALLLEPPAGVPLGGGIAAVRTDAILPLATASVRGIALDDRTSMPVVLSSAVRALRPGGRLIAPVAASLPPGVVERARDDRHWVADAQVSTSPPIQLVRPRDRNPGPADANEGA